MSNLISSDWLDVLLKFPNAHFLQTSYWAKVKSDVGWKNELKTWEDTSGNIVALASILKKNFSFKGITLPLCILYIPRGPIMNWDDEELRHRVLSDLKLYGKQEKALFLKIDPEVNMGAGMPGTEEEWNSEPGQKIVDELKTWGWQYSQDQIQFKNTVHIDLTFPVDDILSRMKQKTRYNIRLAERKGVIIRQGDSTDFELLFRMYAETSLRDGFVIRSKEYYFLVWNIFLEAGLLTPLIADVEGEPVAALMLFHFGETAWYVYGMSRDLHRNLMPTYLLQWQAIKKGKEMGCKTYDLWGAPDIFEETDPMWGVYRFKQGLGGKTLRSIGAWDLPIKPVLYKLYLNILPKILNNLRKKGFKNTQSSLGA